MNKFFIAAIAAATIIPAAANAQPFGHRDNHVVVVDRHAPAWHRPTPVTRLAIGSRVDDRFVSTHETVRNPGRYKLARATSNTRWLKVSDDAVLVNLRTGRVLNIAYNLFR